MLTSSPTSTNINWIDTHYFHERAKCRGPDMYSPGLLFRLADRLECLIQAQPPFDPVLNWDQLLIFLGWLFAFTAHGVWLFWLQGYGCSCSGCILPLKSLKEDFFWLREKAKILRTFKEYKTYSALTNVNNPIILEAEFWIEPSSKDGPFLLHPLTCIGLTWK